MVVWKASTLVLTAFTLSSTFSYRDMRSKESTSSPSLLSLPPPTSYLCLALIPHSQVSSFPVFSHQFLPELPPQNHSHPQSWGSGAGSMWLPMLKGTLIQQTLWILIMPLKKLFLFIILFFMCMCILVSCIFMQHMHFWCPHKPKKGSQMPWN